MNKEDFIALEASNNDLIFIRRIYVELTGRDLVAGNLLSRIVWWHLPSKRGLNRSKLRVKVGNDMWLAKNRADWWEECCISEWQYDKAIATLEHRGYVTVRNSMFNGKRTPMIKLNWAKLIDDYENFVKKQAEEKEIQDDAPDNDIESDNIESEFLQKPTRPSASGGYITETEFLIKSKTGLRETQKPLTENTTETGLPAGNFSDEKLPVLLAHGVDFSKNEKTIKGHLHGLEDSVPGHPVTPDRPPLTDAKPASVQAALPPAGGPAPENSAAKIMSSKNPLLNLPPQPCPACAERIEKLSRGHCPHCGASLLSDFYGKYVMDKVERIFMSYRMARGKLGKPTTIERAEAIPLCKQLVDAGYTPDQIKEFVVLTAKQDWVNNRPNWGLSYVCKEISKLEYMKKQKSYKKKIDPFEEHMEQAIEYFENEKKKEAQEAPF